MIWLRSAFVHDGTASRRGRDPERTACIAPMDLRPRPDTDPDPYGIPNFAESSVDFTGV